MNVSAAPRNTDKAHGERRESPSGIVERRSLCCRVGSFCRIGLLALIVCLWSCEWDPFDSNSKEIAHGYRLKRIGNPGQFALLAPNDTGGIIIDEIGWDKPFIIARAAGSEYWDRIDTDHAEHTRISDSQRRSNPKYRTIPTETAEVAWNDLKPHKRMW
jgi:hypothetical protein